MACEHPGRQLRFGHPAGWLLVAGLLMGPAGWLAADTPGLSPSQTLFVAAMEDGDYLDAVQATMAVLERPAQETWLVRQLGGLPPERVRWVLPTIGSSARQPDTLAALAQLAARRQDDRTFILNTLWNVAERHTDAAWQQAASLAWTELEPEPRTWLMEALARSGGPHAAWLLRDAIVFKDEAVAEAMLQALPNKYMLPQEVLERLGSLFTEPAPSDLQQPIVEFLARGGAGCRRYLLQLAEHPVVQASTHPDVVAALAAARVAAPTGTGTEASVPIPPTLGPVTWDPTPAWEPAASSAEEGPEPGPTLPWEDVCLILAILATGACAWQVLNRQRGAWAFPALVLVPPLLLAGLLGRSEGPPTPENSGVRSGAPSWEALRLGLWEWLQGAANGGREVGPPPYPHPAATAELRAGDAFRQLTLRVKGAQELVLLAESPKQAQLWLLLDDDRVARGELHLSESALLVLDYEGRGIHHISSAEREAYFQEHPGTVRQGGPPISPGVAGEADGLSKQTLALVARLLAVLMAGGLTAVTVWQGFQLLTRDPSTIIIEGREERAERSTIRPAEGTWPPYPRHVKEQLLETKKSSEQRRQLPEDGDEAGAG